MRSFCLLLIFALVFSSPAAAQDQNGKAGFTITPLIKDPLKRMLRDASISMSPQSEPSAAKELDPAAMLKTLKNPFVSKLPKSEPPSRSQPIVTVVKNSSMTDPNLSAEAAVPELRIAGLVWNTKKPQAIVNDQVVNIGDAIGLWTITKINREGIEVTGKTITYFIKP